MFNIKSIEVEENIKNKFIEFISYYIDVTNNFDNCEKLITENREKAIIISQCSFLSKIFESFKIVSINNLKVPSNILFRTIFETIVKMNYLVHKNDDETCINFIKSSLVIEKKYYESLNYTDEKNSMTDKTKESIMNLVDKSGIDRKVFHGLTQKNSKFINLFDMISEMNDNNQKYIKIYYDIFYRTSSNYSHGNWSALFTEFYKLDDSYTSPYLYVLLVLITSDCILKSNEKHIFLTNNQKDKFISFYVYFIKNGEGK